MKRRLKLDIKRILATRRKMGLAQYDLAYLADVSVVTIGSLERGKNVHLGTLKKVLDVLGLPMDEIVKG
jgi:transcriptional regulator with XRE-family HTH domain